MVKHQPSKLATRVRSPPPAVSRSAGEAGRQCSVCLLHYAKGGSEKLSRSQLETWRPLQAEPRTKGPSHPAFLTSILGSGQKAAMGSHSLSGNTLFPVVFLQSCLQHPQLGMPLIHRLCFAYPDVGQLDDVLAGQAAMWQAEQAVQHAADPAIATALQRAPVTKDLASRLTHTLSPSTTKGYRRAGSTPRATMSVNRSLTALAFSPGPPSTASSKISGHSKNPSIELANSHARRSCDV